MNGEAAKVDWGRLLAQHQGWLRAVILARTGEPQAVDEVWQEVSLATVKQQDPLIELDKAPQWWYRQAVIQSIRHRRQQVRQTCNADCNS